MGRNCFRFSRPLQHEQLWKNGNGLKEDGKRPHDFRKPEVVIEDETENQAGHDEVFDFESIDGRVVSWSAT